MIKSKEATSSRTNADRSEEWQVFRRVCGETAVARYAEDVEKVRALEYLELRQEPFANLVAELQVQQEVQRRLALEYASALHGCRRLQEKIAYRSDRQNTAPCPELDRRLEREVLELAICEEAYELVCEEMDQVRRELARRGTALR